VKPRKAISSEIVIVIARVLSFSVRQRWRDRRLDQRDAAHLACLAGTLCALWPARTRGQSDPSVEAEAASRPMNGEASVAGDATALVDKPLLGFCTD
jgi:hypothetical protein